MGASRRYVASRVLQSVVTLAVALVVAFLVVTVPRHQGLPPVTADTLSQFWSFLGGWAGGDFGQSTSQQQPVLDAVAEGAPWTLLLVASSTLIALVTGIVFGLLMAYYEGGVLDALLSALTVLLRATPGFTIAFLAVLLFFYEWSLFPTSRGLWTVGTEPGLNWPFVAGVVEHASLPVAALVLSNLSGVLAMRASSIRVLGQDHVRASRLRGLAPSRVAFHYVGKNAFIPAYTTMLVALGELVGTTIVVEIIFAYPGLGQFLYTAAGRRDFPLIAGIFAFISVVVVLAVLLADLTYGFIDPRVGSGAERSGTGVVAAVRAAVARVRRRLSGSPESAPDVGEFLEETDAELASDVSLGRTAGVRGVLATAVAPLRVVWADTRGKIGATVTGAFVVAALVGPHLVSDAKYNEGRRLLQPLEESAFVLGTNHRGQDLLELMVNGLPDTLTMVLPGAVAAAVLATLVGLGAGYFGGALDGALMTVADAVVAVPGFPLLIALMPVFGTDEPMVVGLALGLTFWGSGAREIRSQVASIKNSTYVEAARAMGLSTRRIVAREIFPQVYPYALMKFVDALRYVTVGVITLYFLGAFGWGRHQPHMRDINWGVIVWRAEEQGMALLNPDTRFWLFLPLAGLVLFLLGILLLSQAFDRLANVRLRARNEAGVPAGVVGELDEPEE